MPCTSRANLGKGAGAARGVRGRRWRPAPRDPHDRADGQHDPGVRSASARRARRGDVVIGVASGAGPRCPSTAGEQCRSAAAVSAVHGPAVGRQPSGTARWRADVLAPGRAGRGPVRVRDRLPDPAARQGLRIACVSVPRSMEREPFRVLRGSRARGPHDLPAVPFAMLSGRNRFRQVSVADAARRSTRRLRFLCTNDDGVMAHGLDCLVRAASPWAMCSSWHRIESKAQPATRLTMQASISARTATGWPPRRSMAPPRIA